MDLNNKLGIILITYNRKECLKDTFCQIFAENSPIKNCDITILDNRSTDGTSELVEEYSKKYSNVKHIRNKVNIGGNANFAKAATEVSTKEYTWVLCDNDVYDWSNWYEVEKAIEDGYEAILTGHCSDTPADIFYTATFVPACIFKTSTISDTVADNIYNTVPVFFPQNAIIANSLNKNLPIYIVEKDIVLSGINPEHDTTYTRGTEREFLPDSRKHMFWSVGYFSTLELIKDRKMRYEIIDGTRHYHKSLFDLFKTTMVQNKIFHGNYFYNFIRIFRMLNFKQKLKFISAFLIINLSFKDYTFYELRSKDGWIKYFEKVNEQKYIDNLARKLKGKNVLLYGAGIISEVLFENYDLSKFNIMGISDKRFERTEENEFRGYKAIRPDKLKEVDFDVILFTPKLYKKIEKSLKQSGIKQKTYPLTRQSSKYAVRT